MPLDASKCLVARLELVIHLARLPVPEADIATRVTRRKELAVWTAVEVDA